MLVEGYGLLSLVSIHLMCATHIKDVRLVGPLDDKIQCLLIGVKSVFICGLDFCLFVS